MRCFGLPNRDASPAARTIAAMRIVSSTPTVTLFTTTGCDGGPSPTPSASIRRTVSSPSVTSPTIA